MDYETPHEKYLYIADSLVGLRGKRVCEAGGCTPIEKANVYAPSSWQCANLNREAVDSFNAHAKKLALPHFSAACADITKSTASEEFDVVYSINAFEHFHDVEKALNALYRALKPNGYLFAFFGPIWSSDVGHHLSIPTEDGKGLHFFDGALEPWEHLTSTRDQLKRKLEARYGHATAERAVDYIYDYHDLNRRYEHEYFAYIAKSGFSRVLVLKNRKGTPPAVNGATSTRELVLLLKKGTTSTFGRLVALARFAIAYGLTRLGWRP